MASGRLEVRTIPLHALEVPDGLLDGAFSIDVNVFWTRSPTPELSLLLNALRPGGVLHICYGSAGPQTSERVTAPIAAALTEHGFVEVAVRAEVDGTAVSARTPG